MSDLTDAVQARVDAATKAYLVEPGYMKDKMHAALTAAGVPALLERLDLVTCHVCDELMIPGEDVLPTSDSWAHEACMTEGP